MLDCNIRVSEFRLLTCYYIHFQTNTLKKPMKPLIPQLWVKSYYCCSYLYLLKYPTKVTTKKERIKEKRKKDRPKKERKKERLPK